MSRLLRFDFSIGCALASLIAGCTLGSHTQASTGTCDGDGGCNTDNGCGGEGSDCGGDNGCGGSGGGSGSGCGGSTCPNPTPPSSAESWAHGAPLYATLSGNSAASLGGSWAWFPNNVGPNSGSVTPDASLDAIGWPAFKIGPNLLLTSRTEATSALDVDARAGALGQNLSFDSDVDPSEPIRVDLLAAGGSSIVPASLVGTAYVELGAFAAWTRFEHGVLLPSRYRVAQADLVIGSPAIKDAAAQLYQAIGTIDRMIEQIVNTNVSCTAIGSLVGGAFPIPTITVSSNMQDKIFGALLEHPLTSHNQVVTIDLSTGQLRAHLDQIVAGGLNNQPPNTELINSNDYPLVAGPVQDVMHDATNIAVGTIDHSLDAVRITLRWRGPVGALGDWLDVTWCFTLQQAITGTMPAPTNNSTGNLGETMGTSLVASINLLRTGGNTVGQLFRPAYDLVIADAGNGVFDLAINQITFGFTSTVVNTLQPVFGMAAQVVSIQLNHQTTGTCTNATGATVANRHSVSALSIGILQATNAARLDLGYAAGAVTLPDCH